MPSRLPSWTLLIPLVLAALTSSSAAPPPPGGASVTVINDAAHPVPVSGSVTATLGDTPIPVSGSVTATLAETPTVQVPKREPIFVRVGKSNTGLSPDYTVPANKIFVIESISVSTLIAPEVERDIMSLRIRPPGIDVINHPSIQYVPVLVESYGRPAGIGGHDAKNAAASLTTRLYAGPSHDLIFGAPQVAFGFQFTSTTIIVSGYLVPPGTTTLAP